MSEIIINEVVTTVDLTVTEIITTQTIVINEAVGIIEIVAGTNVTVDNTNPLRPVVSASGGGGGASVWGSITGTLSDQTDLQNALDDKLDADATTAEVEPSTNRNYQTDNQNTYNDFTSSGQEQLNAKQNISITVDKISGTKTLSNADNGKVFILTANCVVTIPNGLTAGFNATFRTLAGATYSQSLGGSVTLLGNIGTTMAEKLSFTMVNTSTTNEYLITGSL